MSTRGIYGFRLLDKDYLSYNHSDSYPTGLGSKLLDQYKKLKRTKNLEAIKAQVHNIKMVSENGTLPADVIEHLQLCFPENQAKVLIEGANDMRYKTLRHFQGNILHSLDYGLMFDGSDFIHDSLFCEWGYVFNLNTEELEIYRGFSRTTHKKGRYQNGPNKEGYYSCHLVACLPLNTITKHQLKKIEEAE
jgi:hypothetical protein